jgi:O-acetyl-ADP-ribose deacetylase (regulator of RNase III)
MTSTIQVVVGDLFQVKSSLLVVPVNTVGAMGRGVALTARELHPDLYYHYKKLCRQKKFNLNSIAIYQPRGARYKVAMVPTKGFWGDKS